MYFPNATTCTNHIGHMVCFGYSYTLVLSHMPGFVVDFKNKKTGLQRL